MRVENLTRSFGSILAVDNVSFVVEEGTIFGFLGPNGAGKTTTINILCTLLSPTSGKAYINGHDCYRESSEVRKSIGIVFQDSSLDKDLTARKLHFMPISTMSISPSEDSALKMR
jgi:ABC-2 type transport system ATP-binding protein